jgi:hypothetical protein
MGNRIYLRKFVTMMFYKYNRPICNTIHHLIEFKGNVF